MITLGNILLPPCKDAPTEVKVLFVPPLIVFTALSEFMK
jgi:hypothetical protein